MEVKSKVELEKEKEIMIIENKFKDKKKACENIQKMLGK